MQPPDEDSLTMDVGVRLKQLRSERGKSLRALARSSGLSTNGLSMIERGRTSPSVSTLYKLADALSVPITAFFRNEPDRQDIVFRKSKERRSVAIPKGVWEGLGGESFTGRVEAFMITLEKDANSGMDGMIHTGAELVLCLEGELIYYVEEHKFLLEAGDSLIFAAQLKHHWTNAGESTAKAVIIISGFETGERPSEFHAANRQ